MKEDKNIREIISISKQYNIWWVKDLGNYLEKYKNKLSLISEVCIDESKLHIESSQAIEEIRKILGEE